MRLNVYIIFFVITVLTCLLEFTENLISCICYKKLGENRMGGRGVRGEEGGETEG